MILCVDVCLYAVYLLFYVILNKNIHLYKILFIHIIPLPEKEQDSMMRIHLTKCESNG